jgi:histidinol-phosphatase (PHP family)
VGHRTRATGDHLLDLHLHSICSVDGGSSILEFGRQAKARGLAEIGFCEHVDLDPRDEGFDYLDLDHYDQAMAEARSAIHGVHLRQGVEITYQAGLESRLATWLAGHTWDYVMASVHLVDYADGWALVSEPGSVTAYFATHTQEEAYRPYFEELLRAARSGLGDLLGHLDLVKRYGVKQYGPFVPGAFEEEIRAVLRAAIMSGTGLELNTSGWRQAPGECYPALTILHWYRELGGEVVTVGSDAHHCDQLAAGIVTALDLIRTAGFRAVATFEERRLRWLDL